MMNDQEKRQLEAIVKRRKERSPFSKYLQEVIYGGVDGIVTTFAIVSGFTGAALSHEATTQLSFMVVLLFGMANLFADSLSMGLGNFLSVRGDKSLYKALRKREVEKTRENPEQEAEETRVVLMKKGFRAEDAAILTEIYKKNEEYWIDFMMNHELEISNPDGDNPMYTGLATFLAFVCFGLMPLLPFMIFSGGDTATVFTLSSLFALFALLVLGVLKWRVVGTKPVRSVLEIVLVGSVAASVAFIVGTFFVV